MTAEEATATTTTTMVDCTQELPLSHPQLTKFIQLLTNEFKRGHQSPSKKVNEQTIKQLFTEFVNGKDSFDLRDLTQFCYYDTETPYTRNLIHENEHFSLMLLVWSPNSASCIHSHGGSQCWLRVLHGHMNELFYHIDPNDPSYSSIDEESIPTTIHSAKVNDTCYIDDSQGVHRIENAEQLTITLHCYAPPYNRCKCYDKNGRQIIGTMSFDSEHGIVKSKSKTLRAVTYESLYSPSIITTTTTTETATATTDL